MDRCRWYAVLETDGKKLTIDANVAELGAKARISTDTNLQSLMQALVVYLR